MKPQSSLLHGLIPNNTLFQAFVPMLVSPPDRQPLRDYLSGVKQTSQADIACCCKALQQLSATSSREQLNTIVALVRSLMPVGAKDRFL